MENIKITLTEFINFVNKSGTAKATVVRVAKKRRKLKTTLILPTIGML